MSIQHWEIWFVCSGAACLAWFGVSAWLDWLETRPTIARRLMGG